MLRAILMMLMLLSCAAALGQTGNLDAEREQRAQQFRDAGVPNPSRIREAAAALFVRPVAEQSEDQLRVVAREANAYANYVGMIRSEYEAELRRQPRFPPEQLEATSRRYSMIANEFLLIRNTAYFNLARKAEMTGDRLGALLLYNDAYRLSFFDCSSSSTLCPRVDAEVAMQELLGITDITPYRRR
jgi:hypothetical protein